jgi:hypothetical protein
MTSHPPILTSFRAGWMHHRNIRILTSAVMISQDNYAPFLIQKRSTYKQLLMYYSFPMSLKGPQKTVGLNFSFSPVPTVEGFSSIVTYTSWCSRWRSPGDGHNATLGEDKDGSRVFPCDIFYDELHQAARHSMAVIGRIIAQACNAKQLGS